MSRRLAAASVAATLALALAPAVAAQGPERGVTVVEKRVALVIGNGAYAAAPLRNPVNDARAMAQTLRGLGFDVVERENLGQNEMRRAILDFGRRLLDGGVGLFYFAGHGMQVGGRNFLIPIAAEARSEDEVEVEAVDVAYVLARMSTARNRLNIVVLDACRDNPFARAFRTSARGLASIDAPTGTIIAYATAPGKTARDGEGANGLYTGELVKMMTAPGLKIEEVFKRVRQSVQQRTGGDQVPWEASSLVGDFVFALPAVAARPAPAPAASPPAVAAVPPASVRIESSPPGAEVYWDARPAGKTPLALPAADPGRHQLVLVLEGYATVIEDVEVTAGQPLVIAKKLEEHAGSLEIVTKPPGARIELDGVPVGASPQRLGRVRVGKHKVVLSHKDYQAVEREVTIEYEQLARLEAELSPRPGRLVVTSTPGQAEVWVGDRKLGVTVWAGELPPGRHRIRVAKEGYEDSLFDLLLDPNDAKSLDARLKKWDFGEMVPVPAGEFWMGSDEDPDERPRHRVFLDAYQIDKHEVTNAEYRRFLDASGRAAPSYWTDSQLNGSTQPVVGVTWHDADAYCRWAGKRLPTEAEWEKAARGTDGRKYPWGEQWDSSRANSDESKIGKTTPVGTYPTGVSPYGAHDIAGNVWEWVADWYATDYYQRSPQRSPKGPDAGTVRVLRGGSWSNLPLALRSASRYNSTPDYRDYRIGFRCARKSP